MQDDLPTAAVGDIVLYFKGTQDMPVPALVLEAYSNGRMLTLRVPVTGSGQWIDCSRVFYRDDETLKANPAMINRLGYWEPKPVPVAKPTNNKVPQKLAS
jgi:hypothetical protein